MARCSGPWLSLRRASVAKKASADMKAADSATREMLAVVGSLPPRMPPIAGPRMKPSPKAAPSIPNALGRSASGVMSAT